MASLSAMLFGATVAIAIGPIALLIISASASAGHGVGIRSAFGAAAADFTYALVAFLAGSYATSSLASHFQLLSIVASLVLVTLGVWIAVRALQLTSEMNRALPEAFLNRPLRATYVLTIMNPLTIVGFAGLASLFRFGGSAVTAVWYAFCVSLGSLSVQLALAIGGAGLGLVLRNPRHLQWLHFVSGGGIAIFGIIGFLRQFVARP